jgi:hypothetical protein
MNRRIMMSNQTIKLIIGTNISNGLELLKRNFKNLSWWSDNLETVAHYYEGCAVEITVRLDPKIQKSYVRCMYDCRQLHLYTYGSAEIRCPKGATWYSFSKKYLEEHVIDIKEIFPGLSEFNEEE